ncbi:MAG: hypothetical protein WD317_05290 [Balneolaceae bacterium]
MHPAAEKVFNIDNSVKISLCTDDAGKMATRKDIHVAAAIEKIYKL